MNIKKLIMAPLLALTCLALLAPRAQAVTYNQGDLLMGFHSTSGMGNDQTYVVNIGQGALYRDAAPGSSFTLSTNVASALSSIFGANWFTNANLFYGVAGSPLNSIVGNFNGDPTKTTYASNARINPDVQSSPWVIPTSSARGQASTDMVTLQGAFMAAASNQIATSSDNDWAEFNPPATSISFSAFNPSIEGNPNQLLDLYRIPGNDPNGQFLGTFTLGADGSINFAAAVPEPSTYALLACGALAAFGTFLRRRSQAAA